MGGAVLGGMSLGGGGHRVIIAVTTMQPVALPRADGRRQGRLPACQLHEVAPSRVAKAPGHRLDW